MKPLAAGAVIAVALLCGAVAGGDEAREKLRAKLLEQMRERAVATKVHSADSDRQPKLQEKPVFRYDDQQRGFIDATIWVWTLGGRPIAFEKIEVMREFQNKPQWNYCFTSLAEGRLNVDWGDGRKYDSTEPGIAFQLLKGAPAPAQKATERKRQFRELARSFSARIVLDPKNSITEEMRPLATPLFEYTADSGLVELAIFGYSTAGTNPDMLVVLDVHEHEGNPAWHYAPVRMTAGGVVLKHGEVKVYEVPFVLVHQAPFPTWTYFQIPRVPAEDEE